MGRKSNAEAVADGIVRYAALALPTAAGVAMVFIPSPMTPVTVPAGIAILYGVYRINSKGGKK